MQNIIAMHSQFQYKYTPCYKQFLPGVEKPEESADAEKSKMLRWFQIQGDFLTGPPLKSLSVGR